MSLRMKDIDRVGVAAETTRGHDEKWFRELAERMIAILRNGK